MTIASMAVAKKTENGIETRTDGGTEIGKDLENIAKGIVTGLRVENVTVTEIGVTEKDGIVTATKATATDERNVRLEKTEINPRNREKKKDTARMPAPKLPAEARRRVN